MADSGYVIYGANGYTGRLIARYAVERGQRPILAGRNARALESMASTLGLHARAFDLGDTAALDRGLAGGRAVLHCAGPFAHTSPPMVDACLRNRVAYLDITGEVPVFEAEELIGIRLASGHYRYDPTTGRFWLAGTVQGSRSIEARAGRTTAGTTLGRDPPGTAITTPGRTSSATAVAATSRDKHHRRGPTG